MKTLTFDVLMAAVKKSLRGKPAPEVYRFVDKDGNPAVFEPKGGLLKAISESWTIDPETRALWERNAKQYREPKGAPMPCGTKKKRPKPKR